MSWIGIIWAPRLSRLAISLALLRLDVSSRRNRLRHVPRHTKQLSLFLRAGRAVSDSARLLLLEPPLPSRFIAQITFSGLAEDPSVIHHSQTPFKLRLSKSSGKNSCFRVPSRPDFFVFFCLAAIVSLWEESGRAT